jgi:acyl-CoA thioesterase
MGTFKTLQEAQEYFKNDRFATDAGMKIEKFSDNEVVCSVTIGEKLKNANGGVMGGAIFTLADFAFAVAVNQVHLPTVAQQVSSNYLSAPKGERLFARAVCKKDGRTSCVYNVDVTDDTGREIAQFVGTGFKLL